ncbi:MAG: hypothetical protein JOY68_09455 [Candidatus Dormibacteraeota bacterium]|nr:hypothetical protein [Candidatus Dormibacteraeota bacterium]MBV8445494.1 hypothetical protein [Candidatus Dormibacteraeota bacterium]
MSSFDAPPPPYFADPPPPPPLRRSRFGWLVAAVVLAGAGIGGYAIAEAVSATTAASSVINTSAEGSASVQAATNPQAAASTATPSPTMHCPNMGGSSGSSTSTSGYFPG